MLRAFAPILVVVAGCGASVSEDCSDPENATWCNGPTDGDESAGTSESGDTAGMCSDEFAEPQTGAPITITVRNDRTETIYMPWFVADCAWEPILLSDAPAGERVIWSGYAATCEQMVLDGCIWGCSDGSTSVLRLDPGATYDFEWDGYVRAPIQLSAGCVGAAGCMPGDTCWAGRQLSTETLSATIAVSTACETGACDCGSAACILTVDTFTAVEWSAGAAELQQDVQFSSGSFVWSIG